MRKFWQVAIIVAALLMLPSAAKAQLDPDGFALGFGSIFGEESDVFSKDALYMALHWNGISFQALDADTTTGIGIEIHPASLINGGELMNVDYRIWSLTRVSLKSTKIKALQQGPGSKLYIISDFLIGEGGGPGEPGGPPRGFEAQFDWRGGFGAFLGKAGPGRIFADIYLAQDSLPIAWLIGYRF